VLDDAETHHCIDVLRLGVGSRVVIFDGHGSEITAEITAVGNGRAHLKDLMSVKMNLFAAPSLLHKRFLREKTWN